MMNHFTEERAGFEITTNVVTRRLEFRSWGFYDRPMAERCRDALNLSYVEMSKGGPWDALSDHTGMLPQKADVQEIVIEAMVGAVKAGVRRVAFVVDSAVTKLQLRRLALDTLRERIKFFESNADALMWLDEQ